VTIERFKGLGSEQRHLVYQHVRQTLGVLHAAQVSYAFLHYAQEHGLERAIAVLPALVAEAPYGPLDLWVADETDTVSARRHRTPTPAVIDALVTSGYLTELARLRTECFLPPESTDD
jgi:hypothetical protein